MLSANSRKPAHQHKHKELLNIKDMLKEQIDKIRKTYQKPTQINISIPKSFKAKINTTILNKRSESKKKERTNNNKIPLHISITRPATGVCTPNEPTPLASPIKYAPPMYKQKNTIKLNPPTKKTFTDEVKPESTPINMTNVNVFLPSHSSHFMFYNNFVIKNSTNTKTNINSRESSANRKRGIHSYKNSIANISTNALVVTKYSYYSKGGYIPDNLSKPNQDNFIVAPKLNSKLTRHFFGVCLLYTSPSPRDS